MFCQYCGSEMRDGDIFCGNCGKSVTEQSNDINVHQDQRNNMEQRNNMDYQKTMDYQRNTAVQKNAATKQNMFLINVILGAVAVILTVVNILLVVSIKTIEKDTNNSYVYEMATEGIEE